MDTMPTGSQPVLAQESLAGELLTPKANVVHDALAQDLQALDDGFVSEQWKDGIAFLEYVSAYKTKNEKLK